MNKRIIALSLYLANLSQVHGQPIEFGLQWDVDPEKTQKIIEVIQKSSAFLGKINIVPVDNQKGETIGLDATPVASTTDTNNKDRETTDPTGATANGYLCEKVNFDTEMKYAKLDAWAHRKDFQQKIANLIVNSQGLALLMMGFNGIKREPNSDIVANPLMQDVAVGWLQKIRNHGASQVFKEHVFGSGEITIGSGKDYENLDALVIDAVSEFIEEQYRNDEAMVVTCSRKMLDSKIYPLVNGAKDTATETIAAEVIIGTRVIGGMVVHTPSYFPDNTMLITKLSNLSIYEQIGTHRRLMVDNPKRDQIENYESRNIDFVVEDYKAAVLIENIKKA